MKRFLIFGAGRQGVACAEFLLTRFTETQVCFIDQSRENLQKAQQILGRMERISEITLDLTHDTPQLYIALSACDCVVSCVPFFLNQRLSELAVKHKKHFCDLGGNLDVVRKQIQLDEKAKRAGMSLVPDCGLAPGTVNVLAEYWNKEWKAKSIRILCGGLPLFPKGVMKYESNFSLHGLINEYFETCEVSRMGKLEKIPGLSEPESVSDLAIEGVFEAFQTSGGASLAPEHYAPLHVDYEYKTLRYPGHRDALLAMREAGFFSDDPVDIPAKKNVAQGQRIAPRRLTEILLENAFQSTRRDLIVAKIIVKGAKGESKAEGVIDLIDYADDAFTAMERTTGFSLGIVAAWICDLYDHEAPRGAFVPFAALPPKLLVDELRRQEIEITLRENIE